MMFKGHKVYLCVDEQGKPVVRNNKVLIKYQINHDYEYYVSPNAVQPIDPNRLKKTKDKKTSQKTQCDSERIAFTPEGETIKIYTDGASSGNPGPSGIGIYFQYNDKEKEMSRYIGHATNNIAELMAIKVALKNLKKTDIPVRLYTDSNYCYGLLMLGWKPKMNRKLVDEIRATMKKFRDLKIIKIEGHAGILYNERADQLARAAIQNSGSLSKKI
jgi:ribonuclease HI